MDEQTCIIYLDEKRRKNVHIITNVDTRQTDQPHNTLQCVKKKYCLPYYSRAHSGGSCEYDAMVSNVHIYYTLYNINKHPHTYYVEAISKHSHVL